MPSTMCFPQSGGIGIVSGDIYSGVAPLGGIFFKLVSSGAGLVYLGLPNASGDVNTITSGRSMASGGGLGDAMEMYPGDKFFVPKSRLLFSGIQSVRIHVPATSSGVRLFWEPDLL